MPFVSVTRLRIRSLRFFPAFFYHTFRATRQVRGAAGLVDGVTAIGGPRALWTITVWESEAAMRAYRNTGAHMRAMPKLIAWSDEAAVAHWEQPTGQLPAIADAAQRLAMSGHASKVRHPSIAHAAGNLWPDRVVPTVGLRFR